MFLYLDARREDPAPQNDAAAFCQAIAEMCSLSVAGMERHRLEAERLRFTEQMDAGMAIQRQILPPSKGRIGGVSYSMELRPGRYVAGDLFDILRLDNRRVAFFIGDVAGRAWPAAILMATTQSYLNAALRYFNDPGKAADAVNSHLTTHAPENKFVSLWLGVLDTVSGLLQYVDAGHGYWLLRDPGCEPRTVRDGQGGGAPLRVIDGIPYRADELMLTPGTRLVLYSDGVAEQVGRDGEAFGEARVSAALAGSTSPEQDVRAIVQAVLKHAGTETLDDDLTVGSIHFVTQG